MDVQEPELEPPNAELNNEDFEEEYVITCDDFQEVCRTCLLKTDNLYDSDNETDPINLVNLLEIYSGIKINPNDDLPQNICNDCQTKLLQFHTFVENCQTNNLYLKQLLDESHEDTVIVALGDSLNSGVDFQLSLPQIILVNEEEIKLEEISDAENAKEELLKECLVCKKICVPASEAAEVNKPTCMACKKLNNRKTEITKFICEFCGREFQRSSNLWNHRRTVHPDGKSPVLNQEANCKFCGKFFKSSSRYGIHLKQHYTEKRDSDIIAASYHDFECELCNTTYESIHKLKKHQANVHTNQKFLCPTCGKEFVRNANLQTHLLVHAKEKRHKCLICGKLFTLSKGLKAHMFTHTGEKPHKCLVCAKAFTRPQSLDLHMKGHAGEKPHVCSICDRRFRQSAHLKTHLVTHSGERPYLCNRCGKTFTTNGSLTVHARSHTEDKTFPCGICSNEFHDSSS